jgi:radical SAM-linked protein
MTSVWERSLRRAGLPIAYSEGFTPHAKVSFPDALPVGIASTGEYAELTFAAPIDPGPGLGALSASLPEGMDITTYLEVPDNAPKLARMLGVTLWELAWPDLGPDELHDTRARLEAATQALLDAESVEVVKRRPSGDRILDVRPPLVAAAVGITGPRPWQTAATPTQAPPTGAALVLRAVLSNGGATVRPPDLLTALAAVAPVDVGPPPATRHTCRVAQGKFVDEGCKEALTGIVAPLAPVALPDAA